MSRHSSRTVRRAPVLVVVAAALLIGGVVDRVGAAGPDRAVTAEAVQPVPVAAPAAAYSSSWYCAGARFGQAAGHLVIANAGPAPVNGTVDLIAVSGPPVVLSVTVPAGAAASVPESTGASRDWTGAVVDLDGGAVAVSEVLDGPYGRVLSSCATSGSPRWYLPSGHTRINATETVLLLNPYSTQSIVDLSFSTDQGQESPLEFQGITVPPRSLVAVPLATHLRRRNSIATNVSTRTGTVVAWAAEVVTPAPPGQAIVGTPAAAKPLADPADLVPGLTVLLGAPSAAPSWAWPDGLVGPGLDEQYLIYNPGSQTAQLRLSLGLLVGSAEPLPVSVGPGQVVPVMSAGQPRIPAGVAHTAVLVSTNGVPVVAVRSVVAARAAFLGARHSGIAVLLGERVAAPAWLVPAPATDAHHLGELLAANPGPRPLQITVHGLPGGDQTVSVAPAGRAAWPVPPRLDGLLTATASGAFYAEYDLYGTAGGISFASAVPLSQL